VVNGILQVTNQIFQNIEIGVSVTVTLFFKDTPRNREALGGRVPWQWPKD
tara:strand:- start:210 stop:359 length:150 start_codon:yes stop_codon:yes gene_type:complete